MSRRGVLQIVALAVVIPSSIADLPGARTYAALFENLVQRLVATATLPGAAAPALVEGARHE